MMGKIPGTKNEATARQHSSSLKNVPNLSWTQCTYSVFVYKKNIESSAVCLPSIDRSGSPTPRNSPRESGRHQQRGDHTRSSAQYVICLHFPPFCLHFDFVDRQLFVYIFVYIFAVLRWPVTKSVFCGQLKLQPKRNNNNRQSRNLPRLNPEWYIRFWENPEIWACVWWEAMLSEYLFIPLIRILLLIMLVRKINALKI